VAEVLLQREGVGTIDEKPDCRGVAERVRGAARAGDPGGDAEALYQLM
jgi:hypothetical protein